MLREFSECIGEVLILNQGGRHGTYEGVLEINNLTNPATYRLCTKEANNPNLGSITPNGFNTTHRVNEKNEIIPIEVEAA